MKFRLDETLFLETLASVMANYPNIPEDQFMSIISLDPTYTKGRDSVGKYGKWLLNLYNKGNLGSFGHVTDALTRFEDNKKLLKDKDIGKFKTLDELDTYLNNPDNYNEESARQKVRDAQKARKNADLDEEAEHVINGTKWDVWIPKTYAASCKLGQGSSWCTATTESDHYYNSYSRQGPLYIIINKDTPELKYQFHFESQSFMDVDDYSMDNPYQFVKLEPDLYDYFKPKFADIAGIDLSKESIILNYSYEELADAFKSDYRVNTNTRRDLCSGEFIADVLAGDIWDYFNGIEGPNNDQLDLDDLSESVLEELNRLNLTIEQLKEIANTGDTEDGFDYADEVSSALQSASYDGTFAGTESEVYDDLMHTIENSDLSFLKVYKIPGGINFEAETEATLEACYDDEYLEFFTSGYSLEENLLAVWFYEFEFEEPYYGWSGFDQEAFNERLADELYGIGR